MGLRALIPSFKRAFKRYPDRLLEAPTGTGQAEPTCPAKGPAGPAHGRSRVRVSVVWRPVRMHVKSSYV